MKKYGGLLQRISKELHIVKGRTESELNYKYRIIYSAVGRMAYASLWDTLEDYDLVVDNEPISIVRFKRRIQNLMISYIDMYPELKSFFPQNVVDFSNVIYNLFGATGQFYHTNNRIRPGAFHSADTDSVCYKRGMPVSDNVRLSGMGAYSLSDTSESHDEKLVEMFDLTGEQITEFLESIADQAVWQTNSITDMVFLRTKPPFFKGYWVSDPQKSGDVSIAKHKNEYGATAYYLYKFDNNEMLVSVLPEWLMGNGYHRASMVGILTNGVLRKQGTLPPIKYSIDGDIVLLYLDYILPTSEMNFLKYYSWSQYPADQSAFRRDLNRIIAKELLPSIKNHLESIGFEFKEV